MTRSPAAVLAVLLAAWSLGGCYIGPDPIQYAALAMVDGRPTAVVAACGRPAVDVNVYLNEKGDVDDVLFEWSVTVTLPEPVPYVEVELLGEPRPNWQITSEARTVGEGESSFRLEPLASIEPGRHYTLDSSDGGPEGSSAPAVTFTTDDFTRIEANQVLVPTGHKHSKLISRDSFVSARCH